MRQPARRIVLVLLAMCLLTPIAPDHAVAHDNSLGHLLYGEVVTDRGTLQINARRGPVGTAPWGVAAFTPTGGRRVGIVIDCLRVGSTLEIGGGTPLFPAPSLYYSHVSYAAGWGSDGKRYRMALFPDGLSDIGDGAPVIRRPFVTTRPGGRLPCGAKWHKWPSKWREGGILLLA
jgi:hypothetical protein